MQRSIYFILGIVLYMFIGIGFADQEQQGEFSSTMTLAWDANTEPSLAGYNVYAGLQPGGPYELIGSNEADNTEFTWLDLPNNLDHYFVVTAFNDEGLESGHSNEVCGYTDENHDYGIDCDSDFYTEDGGDSSGGGSSGNGCFINTIGG